MSSERIYPCDRCGKLRSKDEGGTVFTVCDDCWDVLHPRVDPVRVSTLAHNLAVAAALCRAFELGRDLQHPLTNADWTETRRERDRQRAEIFRDYFHPGCGRSAT